MDLIVAPMMPEDRKHLDLPPMPTTGMRFIKDGWIWQLVGVHTEAKPIRNLRLTLEFDAIDTVTPVNPVNLV